VIFQSVEEAGGFQDFESFVTELVSCLDSLYENVALDANNELENDVIEEVLDEILKVLSSPQMDQVLFSFRIALKAKRKDFV